MSLWKSLEWLQSAQSLGDETTVPRVAHGQICTYIYINILIYLFIYRFSGIVQDIVEHLDNILCVQVPTLYNIFDIVDFPVHMYVCNVM